jgi:hypothetical protein
MFRVQEKTKKISGKQSNSVLIAWLAAFFLRIACSHFDSEDDGNTFRRNIGKLLAVYTMSHTTREYSS